MKRIFLTIAVAVCMISASAQTEKRYLRINMLDNKVIEVAVSKIDSVDFILETATTSHNGHASVDLGLPSGLLWATCNIGATAPEEYGDYFAWGETTTKETYDWSTYKWCNGSYDTQTKYNTDSSYGTVDNKTVLVPEDDAAAVNWGGDWRMPTLDEQKELLKNCTWTWTTDYNGTGKKGYIVSSNAEGNTNSIFLPAAGYRGTSSPIYLGRYGYYWSSSLNTSSPNYVDYLYFTSISYEFIRLSRYCGLPVRAVCSSK